MGMRKIAMMFTGGVAALMFCGAVALAAPTTPSPASQTKPPAAATPSNTATTPTKPAKGHPSPNARVVKSGTIRLQCPPGTDKYCDGNNCKCWTRAD